MGYGPVFLKEKNLVVNCITGVEASLLDSFLIYTSYQQKFQMPKIEVLNLIRLFWGWVFPYITLHTAYIGEYLYFRYLKCLVKLLVVVMSDEFISYPA